MSSGDIGALFKQWDNIISESLLLAIISKFLNCLSIYVCILDVEGNIVCANELFLKAFTDCSNESFFPWYLDNQSKVVLQNKLKLVNNKHIYVNNMVLKHNWGKNNIQWSLQSAKEVGLENLIVLSGYERHSIAQMFRRNLKVSTTQEEQRVPSPPSSPPKKSVISLGDFEAMSLTRPAELETVARLIDYGEQESRKKLVQKTKRAAEKKVRDAKNEVENLMLLMSQKQTFVRSIAHEIRTSLNVVVSGLQLLDIELGPKSPVASTIEDMRLACEAAVDTIGDFLAYEKINDGILTADRRLIDFFESSRKCLRPFRLQAKSKGVDLRTAFDDSGGVALVDMDEYKMNQVVRNLVSNAIKFSSEGSVVRVRVCRLKVSESRENVRLEVHDQGPGISKVRLGSVYLLL